MTEKLNLNTLSNITYYSMPEQIVVNTSDLLKQNQIYSIYSGYLRSSPNEKLMIKKYTINDNLNDLTNSYLVRELIFFQHFNKYTDSGVIQLMGLSITEENIYLIFEEMGDYITFDKYIDILKNKTLDNDKIKNIFYNLLTTVNVFHSLGVVNSDFIFDNVMVKKYQLGYDMKIYDVSMTQFLGLGPLLSVVSDIENKPNLEKRFISDKNISFSYDVFSIGLFLLRILVNMNMITFIPQQGGSQEKANPYLSVLENRIKEKETASIVSDIPKANPYLNIYQQNIQQKNKEKTVNIIEVITKPNPYLNIYQQNIQLKKQNTNSEDISEQGIVDELSDKDIDAANIATSDVLSVDIDGVPALAADSAEGVHALAADSAEGVPALASDGSQGDSVDGAPALATDGSESDGAPALATDGSESQGVDGAPALATDGSESDGTPVIATDGSESQGVDGAPALATDGSESLGVDGAPALATDGSESLGVDGAPALATDGSESDGAPALATDGSESDGTAVIATDGSESQGVDGAPALATDGSQSDSVDGSQNDSVDGSPVIASDGSQSLSNAPFFVKVINNEIMISYDNNTWGEVSSQIIKNISPELNNLLINLLHDNANDRICVRDALNDKYFDQHSKNVLPGLEGGGFNKTDIPKLYRYNYTIENWSKKQLELSYIEEIHLNYKDNVLPKFDEDVQFYNHANELLKSFKTDDEINTLITSGIDILANAIIHYRSNDISTKDVDFLKITSVFYSRIFSIDNKFFNGVMNNNKYLDASLQKLISNAKLNIFPIWVHAMYIYIKLNFENKKENSALNYEDTLIESAFEVLLFIMSKQLSESQISLWDVASYGAIKNLANKYEIKVEDVLIGNIVECLKMPSAKYNMINRIQIETLNYIHTEKYENLIDLFGGSFIDLTTVVDIENIIIPPEIPANQTEKIIMNEDGSKTVINEFVNDEGVPTVVSTIMTPEGNVLESKTEMTKDGNTEAVVNRLDSNGNIVKEEVSVDSTGAVVVKQEDGSITTATQEVDDKTGDITKKFSDGKVEITSINGITKIINADGSEELHEPNGDISKTNLDGTIEKIPLNGIPEILMKEEFDEEGNTIQTMEDGSTVKIYKSGVKEIIKDGVKEIINTDGTKTIFKGDNKILVDSNGNEQILETIKTNDMGQIERTLSDGTKEIEIVSDGQTQVQITDSDGNIQTYTKVEKEYGIVEQVYDDKIVTTTPDGITTTVNKQTGDIEISLANGDVETRDKDGNLVSRIDKDGKRISVENDVMKITDKDGNLSMQGEKLLENGNKVIYNSDAQKIEILPDGTRIETKMNELEMAQFVRENDVPISLIKDDGLKQTMIDRSGKRVFKSLSDAYKNCPREIMELPNTRFTVECIKDVIIE